MMLNIRVVEAGDFDRTSCGRPGCSRSLGIIAKVVEVPGIVEAGADFTGARVHLVMPHWHRGPDGRWSEGRARRKRTHGTNLRVGGEKVEMPGRQLVALPPDAAIVCPACGAVEALPAGAAGTLEYVPLDRCEVDVRRIRPVVRP